MRLVLISRLQWVARLASSETFRVVRPIALATLATALLFASVDRGQPWSFVTACLGLALLGAVLTRQLCAIMRLEVELAQRAQQLEVVSEVVSALNSSANVGSTLGLALEKLVRALGADAGAVWLPPPGKDGEMTLVEHRGKMEADAACSLLEQVRSAMTLGPARQVQHDGRVTDGDGSEHAVRCLTVRMGRDAEELGYITLVRRHSRFQEIDGAILAAVGSDIGGALRSVRAISEARSLADKDPLTGLLNHRSAHQRLAGEAERHRRDCLSLSVVMLDLDGFKLFNDTYGHPAGDEVLKRVAGVLRQTCRDSDLVARYGGDEFMLILPKTNLQQALRCAERIQSNLAKEHFRCERSASLPISFSYGISVFPEDTPEPGQLVATADLNLYESKAQGGSRITAQGPASLAFSLANFGGFDLFWPLVVAIDNKDGYTRRHSEEVTAYSLDIARALRLPEDRLQTIQLSAMLHDVGKIGVPDSVLRKPGRLTDEEFGVMRQHPTFGALIVGALAGMDDVVLGVRHHHERFDGRGYPDGLAGSDIPLIGRLMAVADCFSAMTTTRPYRKGLSEREALQEIRAGLGTQFDPEIGEMFIRQREEKLAANGANGSTPKRTRRRKEPAPPADAALVPAENQGGRAPLTHPPLPTTRPGP